MKFILFPNLKNMRSCFQAFTLYENYVILVCFICIVGLYLHPLKANRCGVKP